MITKTKSNRSRAASKSPRALSVVKSNGPPGAMRAVVPLKERRLDFGRKWDYAPAPETFEYVKIPARHELFIDGEFVAPHSGRYFESINPATESKLSDIAAAGEADVDRAVKAARQAYENVWGRMPGRERGKY